MDTQEIWGIKPSANADESYEKAKYEHLAPYIPQDRFYQYPVSWSGISSDSAY